MEDNAFMPMSSAQHADADAESEMHATGRSLFLSGNDTVVAADWDCRSRSLAENADQQATFSLRPKSQYLAYVAEENLYGDKSLTHLSAFESNTQDAQSLSAGFFDASPEHSAPVFTTPLASNSAGQFATTFQTSTPGAPVLAAQELPVVQNSSFAAPTGVFQAKPHPCNVCSQSFRRNCDLRRHYKKHFDSQRAFHCHVNGCHMNGQKGFYRKDKFADHQRKVHGI